MYSPAPGFELLVPSSTLSVDGNCSWRRKITFHVCWWWSYCTHVRLRVIADTNRPGCNLRNCVTILPAFGWSSPSGHLFGGDMQETFFVICLATCITTPRILPNTWHPYLKSFRWVDGQVSRLLVRMCRPHALRSRFHSNRYNVPSSWTYLQSPWSVCNLGILVDGLWSLSRWKSMPCKGFVVVVVIHIAHALVIYCVDIYRRIVCNHLSIPSVPASKSPWWRFQLFFPFQNVLLLANRDILLRWLSVILCRLGCINDSDSRAVRFYLSCNRLQGGGGNR